MFLPILAKLRESAGEFLIWYEENEHGFKFLLKPICVLMFLLMVFCAAVDETAQYIEELKDD
jgi:hypothetical protein